MKKIIPLVILSAALSGCGLYSGFNRPDSSLSGIAGDISVIDEPDSVPQWRDVFHDPVLEALVDSAVTRNTDLKVAALRTIQADAVLEGSKLSFLPSAGLSAQLDNDGSANLTGQATWELFAFGRNLNSHRAAREELAATQAQEHAVRSSLISAVAQAYFRLLYLDSRLKDGKEELDNWNQTVSTLESLKNYSSGVSEADILQARANSLALESIIIELEKNIRETENCICLLMAIPPADIERGTLDALTVTPFHENGICLDLLTKRPDVEQAAHSMGRAYYSLAGARSAFLPSVTLSGSAGWTGPAGIIISPERWLASLIGGITASLLNSGRNIASLKSARAELEAAGLRLSQTLLTAGNEVNDALTALQSAIEKLEHDNLRLEYLADASTKTGLLMQHGGATYLEVLSATQAHIEARESVSQDRYDILCGYLSLLRALGALE